LHTALETEINTGFVRNYFKHNLAPIALKTAKTAGGKNQRIRKKKITKLIDKRMPKSNEEIEQFINKGKENEGQKLLMDIPVNVFDFERGLQKVCPKSRQQHQNQTRNRNQNSNSKVEIESRNLNSKSTLKFETRNRHSKFETRNCSLL